MAVTTRDQLQRILDEKKQHERERLERERLEKERLERERREKEQLDREHLERIKNGFAAAKDLFDLSRELLPAAPETALEQLEECMANLTELTVRPGNII